MDVKKNLLEEFLTPPKQQQNLVENAGREHMRVFLRIRPLTEKEKSENSTHPYVEIENDHSLMVHAPKDSNTFKNSFHGRQKTGHRFGFTGIFDENTSQKEFFDSTVLPTVKDFIDGQNCLIFTYGVTNSGKTYTIQGTPDDGGILPRSLDVLFNSLEGRQWSDYSLKPYMFNDVFQLSSELQEKEKSVKINLFKDLNNEQDATTNSTISEISDISSINSTISDAPSFAGSVTQANLDSTHLPHEEREKNNVEEILLDNISRERDSASINVSSQGEIKFSVWVTFAEIYNEQVFDLLEKIPLRKNARRHGLTLRDDKNGIPYVKGLKEIKVETADEAYRVLTLGKKNLQFACTKLNHQSSRSHCIFTIKVIRVVDIKNPHMARVSMLSFCDLAGAERSSKANSFGDRIKEAGNINASLLILGRCIRILRSNQQHRSEQQIVPFRDSKLTRVFQSFFTGKGRASMIVNINQVSSMFDETLHALKYSAIARVLIVEPEKKKEETQNILKPYVDHFEKTRETVGWATAEDLNRFEMIDRNEASSNLESCPNNSLIREKALLELVETFKKQLVEQKKEMIEMESKLRQEITKEMAAQLVMIEQDYSDSLQNTKMFLEDHAEKRIDLITQSVKKSYKRRRMFEDDNSQNTDDNMNLLKSELSESQKTICDLKSQLFTLSNERDKLCTDKSNLEFQLSNTEMPDFEKLKAELNTFKSQLEVKINENSELNKMLSEAGETFHQKESEIQSLTSQLTQFKGKIEKDANEFEIQLQSLQEEVQNSHKIVSKKDQTISQLEARVDELTKQNSSPSKTVNESTAKEFEAKLSHLQEMLSKAEYTNQMANRQARREKTQLEKLLNDSELSNQELKSTHKITVSDFEKKIEQLEFELDECKNTVFNDLQEQLACAQKQLKDANMVQEAKEKEHQLNQDSLNQKIKHLENTLSSTTNSTTDLQNSIRELEKRLNESEKLLCDSNALRESDKEILTNEKKALEETIFSLNKDLSNKDKLHKDAIDTLTEEMSSLQKTISDLEQSASVLKSDQCKMQADFEERLKQSQIQLELEQNQHNLRMSENQTCLQDKENQHKALIEDFKQAVKILENKSVFDKSSILELEKKLNVSEKTLAESQTEIKKNKTLIQTFKDEIASLTTRLTSENDYEKAICDLKTELSNTKELLQDSLARQEIQQKEHKASVQTLNENIVQLNKEMTEKDQFYEKQGVNHVTQTDSLQSSIQDLNNEISSLKSVLSLKDQNHSDNISNLKKSLAASKLQVDQLNVDLTSAKNNLTKKDAEISESQSEFEKLLNESNKTQLELSDRLSKMSEKCTATSWLEKQVQTLTDQIKNGTQTEKQSNKKITEQNEKLSSYMNEVKTLKAKVTDDKDLISQLKTGIKDQEATMQEQDILLNTRQNEIDSLKAELSFLKNQKSESQNSDKSSKVQQTEKLQSRIMDLQKRCSNLESQVNLSGKEMDDIQVLHASEIQKFREERDVLVANLEKILAQKSKEIESQKQEIVNLKQEISSKNEVSSQKQLKNTGRSARTKTKIDKSNSVNSIEVNKQENTINAQSLLIEQLEQTNQVLQAQLSENPSVLTNELKPPRSVRSCRKRKSSEMLLEDEDHSKDSQSSGSSARKIITPRTSTRKSRKQKVPSTPISPLAQLNDVVDLDDFSIKNEYKTPIDPHFTKKRKLRPIAVDQFDLSPASSELPSSKEKSSVHSSVIRNLRSRKKH